MTELRAANPEMQWAVDRLVAELGSFNVRLGQPFQGQHQYFYVLGKGGMWGATPYHGAFLEMPPDMCDAGWERITPERLEAVIQRAKEG